MFVSVLDDVAEKQQDWATFDEAAKLPFDHRVVDYDRDGVDTDVLAFASDVWDEFSAGLRGGPRAAEFDDVVRFDLRQVVTAMEYSYLANQHLDAITESELQTYDAHNMMLYGFADVDLTLSPSFDRSDLSALRRVLERAQRMVRIGNWVTTWEREVAEGDFTSGIVAHALESGIVSADQLAASREDGVNTRSPRYAEPSTSTTSRTCSSASGARNSPPRESSRERSTPSTSGRTSTGSRP